MALKLSLPSALARALTLGLAIGSIAFVACREQQRMNPTSEPATTTTPPHQSPISSINNSAAEIKPSQQSSSKAYWMSGSKSEPTVDRIHPPWISDSNTTEEDGDPPHMVSDGRHPPTTKSGEAPSATPSFTVVSSASASATDNALNDSRRAVFMLTGKSLAGMPPPPGVPLLPTSTAPSTQATSPSAVQAP